MNDPVMPTQNPLQSITTTRTETVKTPQTSSTSSLNPINETVVQTSSETTTSQPVPVIAVTTPLINKSGNGRVVLLIVILIILVIFVVGGVIYLANSNNNAPTVTTPTVSTPVVPTTVSTVSATKVTYSSTKSLQGDQIVYDLHLLDRVENKDTLISADASSGNISPDGKAVIFLNKPFTMTQNSILSPDVYVYDIATKTTSTYLTSQDALTAVNWSPDGSSITFNQGLSTIRKVSIYDYVTKTLLSSFETSEHFDDVPQYFWVDSNTIVFMTNVIGTVMKPVSIGGFSGISKIDVKTGVVTPLLLPADGAEFSFYGTPVSNGRISIVKTQYALNGSQVNLDSSTFSYFDLDTSTGKSIENTSLTDGSRPKNLISSLLPTELKGDIFGIPVLSKKANVYYVIVYGSTSNESLINGRLFEVDTNPGVNGAFTDLIGSTTVVTEFSIY
ncbi:MAG: hypothetical protein ACMG57_02410 [Candidatus Dojkabacteria bacterium]